MIVGEEHYEVAQRVKQTLQRYKDLQDIIAILGYRRIERRRQAVVARARRLQRFLRNRFTWPNNSPVARQIRETGDTIAASKKSWTANTMPFLNRRSTCKAPLTKWWTPPRR